MAYIQIYFNDYFKDEYELEKRVTLIGRAPNCDIILENPGISNLHMTLRHGSDGSYMLEDNKSRNGVVLNGERVKFHEIQHGDTIQLVQFKLRFLLYKDHPESIPRANEREPLIQLDPYTNEAEIATPQSGHYLNRKPKDVGYISPLENPKLDIVDVNNDEHSTYVMSKKCMIGTARFCEIKTKGFLAPKTAASIEARGDNYMLFPRKRGRIQLNGRKVDTPQLLKHGDRIETANIAIKFFLPQSHK